ncbi:hypothetical protein S7711_10409 [Stachybotrys chartarum IBT 7711]|uniref:Uncharacterized protein n=1 Tax=Stachybotrys chartarum (strain CBS 109288 / IBT 7711) TaxID=1280523 RepID=A0A084B492_STACB|nr:hypothetical protein S7711_10409 [Stachybotrys chartarum IBT 7711]
MAVCELDDPEVRVLVGLDHEDMRHVANRTDLIISKDNGSTQQLLAAKAFGLWMKDTGCAKLLVHGDFAYISPLSAVCTGLTRAVRDFAGCAGIVFFCSFHYEDYERDGISWLLKSFLMQLLVYFFKIDLTPLLGGYLDASRIGVDRLLDLFSMLYHQLPPDTTLFCLIDNINCYQMDENLEDTRKVIAMLEDLVDKPTRGPVFKLLFTNQPYKREEHKLVNFDADATIDMPTLPKVQNRQRNGKVSKWAGLVPHMSR